jgi:2-methylcitrate dehydratase PrpD
VPEATLVEAHVTHNSLDSSNLNTILNITKTLANFVTTVQYEDLPTEAIDQAKLLILDCLGVAIAGTSSPVGQITVKLGRETASGGDATVIGADYATSVTSAAFINATLAHALDLDDTAAGTVAHPSASILPALFALAEKNGCSGRTFLAAYVAGLEVFYRIALASEGQMGGWHRTSTFGALATAAASARILGLTAEQTSTAIGISASLAGGIQANFGTMTKAIQVGNAGRSGVVAALLAREECTANQDTLGDPDGFGLAFYFGQFDTQKIISDLGKPFSIIFPGIGIKIHPCCGLTHAPADITLDLARTHDLAADQVEEIIVYGEELLPQVLVYHRPETGYQGKYSLEYVVASAIVDREITPHTFTDEAVRRPEIQALLGKITTRVRPDSEWEGLRIHPWNHCAEVIVRLKDGTTHSDTTPCARGYPDLPLTTQEILAKFRNCTRTILPEKAIELLTERVLTLETQATVADLISLTRGPVSDNS